MAGGELQKAFLTELMFPGINNTEAWVGTAADSAAGFWRGDAVHVNEVWPPPTAWPYGHAPRNTAQAPWVDARPVRRSQAWITLSLRLSSLCEFFFACFSISCC